MRLITLIVFLLSALLFFSVNISPESLPYAGLVPMLIPFFLLLNIGLFVALVISKKKALVFPLVAIIIGWKFFGVTFQWNPKNEQEKGLSIMSYNVHLFNYEKYKANDPAIASNIFHWIQEQEVDVMGFQEFFQDHTTPSRNALKILSQEGKYEYATQIVDGSAQKVFHGLAIFSKHPIINEGKVFHNRRSNGAMFADLLVNGDTIRVYNTHLESMNIPADKLDNIDGIRENYRETLRKLNRGVIQRATQVKVLNEHIQNSPHPVILMGDFNDVPYSYTYFTLRSQLENAFEAAGKGFGFTFNRILFFLRIDNIFFGNELEALQFSTLKEVDYSDHYPVSAVFRLKPASSSLSEQE